MYFSAKPIESPIDFSNKIMTFNELKKLSKTDTSGCPKLRAALLGDTATQFLAAALKGMSAKLGMNLDLFEADFNQVESLLSAGNSELEKFGADFIIVFQSSQKLLEKHSRLGFNSQKNLAAERIDFLKAACKNFPKPKIICLNYAEIDDGIFGSYANKIEASFISQVRRLNLSLAQLAQETPNFYVCDIAALQNKIGRQAMFNPMLYANAEIDISPDALPQAAEMIFAVINAAQGLAKKCAVLDLDNFLWGGTVGDDGAENLQIGNGLGIGKVFTNIQLWCKKLKERGIILAACSKNNLETAREPFLKNPEMILKMEDFSAFYANWKPKSRNISDIAKELNIGLDSIVFLDDSPIERAQVRKDLPMVCVPELPSDPALYLDFLASQNIFEASNFSEADASRASFYKNENLRKEMRANFDNQDDFLRSLEMRGKAEDFNKFNSPRVAQLLSRTNQFNLRTVRYSQSEVLEFAGDNNFKTFAISLTDNIGSSGIVAAIILRKVSESEVFIDTWAMSCRAFQRGLEFFSFNRVLEFAKQGGFKKISSEYIPTAKNKIAENFYEELGFNAASSPEGKKHYSLDVDKAKTFNTFIISE